MIDIVNVNKWYGDFQVLNSCTTQAQKGDVVVVCGPSGSGKSTLIKLIAAIEKPTSGAVLVGGQNVGELSRSSLPFLRRRLGLVLQDQKLLFDRSVFENVMLPLSITGFPPKEATQRVRAALDKVGLASREKALPPSSVVLRCFSRMNLPLTWMLKQQLMSHEFFTNFTALASLC